MRRRAVIYCVSWPGHWAPSGCRSRRRVPAPAGSGFSQALLAQADAFGVVDESPETNNVTYKSIQVTIVP